MKKILSILVLFSFIFINGFSQTTKVKVKNKLIQNSYEEYYVLKSDKNIKEGPYNNYIDGAICVEGAYKNNERCGIWKSYASNNKVEYTIDYDNKTITFQHKDSINQREATLITDSILSHASERPPFLISGSRVISAYLSNVLRYPLEAQMNGIAGKVVVKIAIDSNGKVKDYIVYQSAHTLLDKEALRVAKLMPLEFIPKIRNGKFVESSFFIPFNFINIGILPEQ